MTERTTSGPVDVDGFRVELIEFLVGRRPALDHVFDGATVDLPGATGRNRWRVDGVVKGAYRVMPIAGPDPTRRMALAVALEVAVEDGPAVGAQGSVETGLGHVRIVLDRPDVLLDTMPVWPEADLVVRALADADIRVEVHGAAGLEATLDTVQ